MSSELSNRVIIKYEIPLVYGRQILEMPEGASVLSVQPQYNNIVLWAVVNPDNEEKEMPYWLLHTGDTMPRDANLQHVSTVLLDEGSYVLHVFEEKSQDYMSFKRR